MNANDLMIGDYILFHHSWYASDGSLQHQNRICQVERIENDCSPIVKWWLDDEDYETEYAYGWEPIPLTEEILERNGFKRTVDNLYHIPIWKTPYSDGGFYIEKWGKGYGLTDHCYAVVNYVHEFQHLLKLVGINKEIKL